MGLRAHSRIDLSKIRIQGKNNQDNDRHPRINQCARTDHRKSFDQSRKFRDGIFYEHFSRNISLHIFSIGAILTSEKHDKVKNINNGGGKHLSNLSGVVLKRVRRE
jgi:hypothetical protein